MPLNFEVNVIAIKNDNKKYKFEKITSANLRLGKPAAEDIKIWIDSIGIWGSKKYTRVLIKKP